MRDLRRERADDRPGHRAAGLPGPPRLSDRGDDPGPRPRGVSRGRRLHPQRSLHRQRQSSERRRHDRARLLGRPVDRLRVGQGALERRGWPGAEQYAGGLAGIPPGRSALPIGAAAEPRRAERGGNAPHPRQHPHGEWHAQGRPGDDRGMSGWRGSVSRDSRQVRTRNGARGDFHIYGAVRAPDARGADRHSARHLSGRRPLRQRRHHARQTRARRDGNRGTRRMHDRGLHGLRRAGRRTVQLRRRDHHQRLSLAHQVPHHAGRSGRRGMLPPATRRGAPALGARRRGARADGPLLCAHQPAHRARAARARRCTTEPDPRRRVWRSDADHRLWHASANGPVVHPGRSQRGRDGRAPRV